jgi:membrane fusion protein (multidrug efflux system)
LAPISGRIGKSIVNEGSLVTPSQSSALAVITQFDQVYVDISQASADYMRLREQISKNEKISVRLFLPGQEGPLPQEGVLQFSGVLVEQSTGALQLRAVFEKKS